MSSADGITCTVTSRYRVTQSTTSCRKHLVWHLERSVIVVRSGCMVRDSPATQSWWGRPSPGFMEECDWVWHRTPLNSDIWQLKQTGVPEEPSGAGGGCYPLTSKVNNWIITGDDLYLLPKKGLKTGAMPVWQRGVQQDKRKRTIPPQNIGSREPRGCPD